MTTGNKRTRKREYKNYKTVKNYKSALLCSCSLVLLFTADHER